jgi:hypothetical protein
MMVKRPAAGYVLWTKLLSRLEAIDDRSDASEGPLKTLTVFRSPKTAV